MAKFSIHRHSCTPPIDRLPRPLRWPAMTDKGNARSYLPASTCFSIFVSKEQHSLFICPFVSLYLTLYRKGSSMNVESRWKAPYEVPSSWGSFLLYASLSCNSLINAILFPADFLNSKEYLFMLGTSTQLSLLILLK